MNLKPIMEMTDEELEAFRKEHNIIPWNPEPLSSNTEVVKRVEFELKDGRKRVLVYFLCDRCKKESSLTQGKYRISRTHFCNKICKWDYSLKIKEGRPKAVEKKVKVVTTSIPFDNPKHAYWDLTKKARQD